jgi:hypothetical protein
MNAARRFASQLPREAVVRLLGRRPGRFDARWPAGTELDRQAETDELRARLGRRFEGDLASLLNALGDDDLRTLARAERVDGEGDRADLRVRLWRHGARLEAGGADLAGTPLQPAPVVLAGRLVHLAAPRGPHPAAPRWPRPVPAPAAPTPPDDEPDSLDDLLAAADRTLGVRLGPRGRDKGAWGGLAARLLGVAERGHDEPDWRGDVEIKTVPVATDRRGRWRVTEDPAISMLGAAPLAKLQRVLWLVRAPLPGGDATFLSWYLLEWDAEVARLVARYLHTRPKGGAGSRGRGWYLHKRFFADAGLLASLNGGG